MFQKKSIKSIIFDLGGVLIDLDENKTINNFGVYVSAFFKQKNNTAFVTLAQQFERGEISSKNFRKSVSKLFNLDISDVFFDKKWNSMIKTIPENRISMLKKLNENYRIFVLSNTNEIHCNYFTKQKYWNFNLFEKVYFSHIIKMRKPEPEIFLHVLKENNLIPEETLFVDDNSQNIESAKLLGLQTILVNSEIEILLNDFLN